MVNAMDPQFPIDRLDQTRLLKQWRWLCTELVTLVAEAFAQRGLKPNAEQCIGFKVPVVFAESATTPNNAYVADLYEQVSFLGDLHRQLAESPDGAKIQLKVTPPDAH